MQDLSWAEGLIPQSELENIKTILEHTKADAHAQWKALQHGQVLNKNWPFESHQKLYQFIYAKDAHDFLGPIWFPTQKDINMAHLNRWMSELNLKTVQDFHAWSTSQRPQFWEGICQRLGIKFEQKPMSYLEWDNTSCTSKNLRGARLNIALSCFQAPPTHLAIVEDSELGRKRQWTYEQLESLATRIALQLKTKCNIKAGDAIAINLPMHAEAVAIYLGIILVGARAVSIADSFAPSEMATRLSIAKTKLLFTQDSMLRAGKEISLYSKAIEAQAPQCVCLNLRQNQLPPLRSDDLGWADFLGIPGCTTPSEDAARLKLKASNSNTHIADPDEVINVLFSSGTTGDPKAIGWTHTTPLKCGADAFLHHDIQSTDVCAWPTNLGWMMGPWLIFASLLNRATLALYDGAPHSPAFAKFLDESKVSCLGLVPSLVKAWRNGNVFKNCSLSSIRTLSSSGECSNPDDMHWLSAQANYAPIIEYCGGTEIGGAYVSSTRIQPNIVSAFSSACFGLELYILDDKNKAVANGELFIGPPSIGLTNTLLNRNHYEAYYENTPTDSQGIRLRRHGDEVELLPNGYYRAHGRADDTMNLGGIKVSSAEIERCLNALDFVKDTAAIAVNPPGGGPSLLVIAAVLNNPLVEPSALREIQTKMQAAIKASLNPLFKIHDLWILDALPRTASNKIMRRVVRSDYLKKVQ